MEPCVIIDPRLDEECIRNLKYNGFGVISAALTDLVDKPISGHPDIQMFIHEKNLFVHPDIDKEFIKRIERYVNVIQCSTKLNKNYPDDIPYNIALVGNFAIHRKNFTDRVIQDYLLNKGITLVDTNQGYAKCSTLIVDNNSIITSDRSINNAAKSVGIDTLLISDNFIDLPGYSHGFIGGASGSYGSTIYLTGGIDHHPSRDEIESFIESKNMQLKILSSKRIIDVGSLFFIG
ncbi:MAG: hypothetical protein FWH53_08250 [Leptospirales bacterium]|nr:hypothetical protein [Leptospirales bacterium]